MKYECIHKVYINKEITGRSADDYEDRLGRFCVIELKKTEYREGCKNKILEMLTCMMKLMGYPGEVTSENFTDGIEVNHCWIREDGTSIYIDHKYWNGHEIKLFCDIMEALGIYLHFDIGYLSAEKLKSLRTP